MESTTKCYKHIFVVTDAFTKFVWLYPTKGTTTKEVLDKLHIQQKTFGSPENIITDRGTAFTSEEFKEYCNINQIRHHCVTTRLPRANGQVERINSIVIAVLTKLSLDKPADWYKHIDKVQRAINSTYQRSISTSPYKLLLGVRMKDRNLQTIYDFIEE